MRTMMINIQRKNIQYIDVIKIFFSEKGFFFNETVKKTDE